MASLVSSSSSIASNPKIEKIRTPERPRRKVNGLNSSGSKSKLDSKKLKKDKARKTVKNGTKSTNKNNTKSDNKTTNKSKNENQNAPNYMNPSDRPYFIFFVYTLSLLFLGINAFYQYKVSKTGIFHEELDIFNVSKYVFCSFMPILLIAIWVSTILTKMRFLLGKMVMFFLKNLKFFMKPEVILFLMVSFISYRVLLFIPMIFKYIHSISDFIPYGGPVVSFVLLISFMFMMFFLIAWMVMIFSYDVSDSILKFFSKITYYIFGDCFLFNLKKNKTKNEETVEVEKEK